MIKEHNIAINAQACIGCGLCAKDCPANNLAVTDKKAVLKSQNCIKCGHCVAIWFLLLYAKHLPVHAFIKAMLINLLAHVP